MPMSRDLSQDSKLPSVPRAIQLRLEAIAAMKLRTRVQPRVRVQQQGFHQRSRAIPGPAPAGTILLLSEDGATRSLVRAFLEHAGHSVVTCACRDRAEQIVLAAPAFDVAIVDAGSAEAVVSLVQTTLKHCGAQIIVLCASDPPRQQASELAQLGCVLMTKPFPLPKLLGVIQVDLDRGRAAAAASSRLSEGQPERSASRPQEGDKGRRLPKHEGLPNQEQLPKQNRSPRQASGARTVRILSIGDYDRLRTSREQVLRLEGFFVESCASGDWQEHLVEGPFDIAIVCQSVNSLQAARIRDALRRRFPEIAIVRVCAYPPALSGESGFDLQVEGLGGPREMIRAIDSLAGRKAHG